MAGKLGQKWSKPMTQHQRDSIALTKIEQFLDKQIDGELSDWSPTRLKALEIRYNKLRPALSSADITAHSSPQIESEEALLAQLQALIAKYPHLISQLQQPRPALAPVIPLHPPSDVHTQHTHTDDTEPA